jgi:hypothetical protein
MEHIRLALAVSFPWLEPAEVGRVCAQIPTDEAGSAAERMRATATALDQLGLPPTSSLLLSIVGRGSKGTAVKISRDVARTRFERAAVGRAQQNHDGAILTDEVSIRSLLEEAVAKLRQPVDPGHQDSEIVQLLRAVAGDVNWLKSTLDTERQLRRYQQAHGELAEPGSRPADPVQERRGIVAQLARSLEANRFGPQYREMDPADGAEE